MSAGSGGTGKAASKAGSKADGRQLRWAKHRAERRQAVIDAAIAVLERHPVGETIHVQEIADRAGIHRTVLYRHFEDRSDLDVAVQREVCRRAGEHLFAAMSLQGTPQDITRRIVDTFVRWMLDHQALVRFVERDAGGGDVHPLDEAIEQVAERIDLLIQGVIGLLGVSLPENDQAALDPFVFGLVGGGLQATKRWISRAERRPETDEFIDLLSRNIWRQITGIAVERGIEIPDVPVDQLIELIAAVDS